jgi:hypothetical protein
MVGTGRIVRPLAAAVAIERFGARRTVPAGKPSTEPAGKPVN